MKREWAALAATLALMVASGCAAATEEPQVQPAAGATDQQIDELAASSPAEETPPADAAVGDVMSLKGTAYRVMRVRTATVLGEGFTEVRADGMFVIVDLTLTNLEDEPATILQDMIRFVGHGGKQYSADTDALMATENAFLLEEIQPDVEQQVSMVYDVPMMGIGAKSALQVSDLFSDSTGRINLGLRPTDGHQDITAPAGDAPNVPAADADTDAAAPAPDAKVGDVMSLTGTSYQVRSARTTDALGESFTRVEADGRFVVVELTLTNLENEPATILQDAIRLVGENGKQYTFDTDALLAVEGGFILEQIQPDVPQDVTMVYDVPPDAIGPAAVLQVSDLFSDSTGTISLGLSKGA